MKQAKLILLILLLANFAFGQIGGFLRSGKDSETNFNEQVFYSYWINPVQFEENLILNYHIRYDFLLFEKQTSVNSVADTFQAKLKILLELTSPELLIPIRKVEEVTIKTAEFENTISKNLYYSSNFSLKVSPKKYKATLTIIDQVRNKEFSIKPFDINFEDENSFELIFIKKEDLRNLTSQEIKNKFYNFLPFSSEAYYLVLPEREDLNQILIENRFVKYNLGKKENSGFRYSIFELDTLDLIEGSYDLRWGNKNENITKLNVIWLDKPEYLKNFDNALKILNYLFENEHNLNRYFADKNEQLRKFYEIWKKFDPTPQTPFNELMAEFYRRADYAFINFKSVSQADGAQTDRGKIYIIYGPPSKVERTFAPDGRSIEIWSYNSGRNLKFRFLDENKNGNFILQQ